jgi:hypothetical protein
LGVQKDPGDPRLQYLLAQDLLLANSLKDEKVEGVAKAMLKSSVELDPASSFSVYNLLWKYEMNRNALEDFNDLVPAGLTGFVEFLEKQDLWKYHRKYYLRSLGIDAGEKYRLSASRHWSEKPFANYSLKDFEPVGTSAFSQADFIYTNGRFEKKISLRNAQCRLELKCKGSKAGNSYPVLLVLLDGKVVDSLYIDTPEFSNFFTILQSNPGNHVLGIEYINDYIMGNFQKRDRNVWIKTIALVDPI